MATVKKVEVDAPVETKRIRITLTSTKVDALESACANLIKQSRAERVKTAGPVRLPTKVLRITTRKTPCGEGSKTWDRYEMRIHKRNIDISASKETVRKITSIQLDPSVDVELIMA